MPQRLQWQMLAGFFFNEMRLPESVLTMFIQSPVWVVQWAALPRGGRLWPCSCLSLSQINSNCLLQLFTGTMSDVFLYSCWPQTPNRRFIMQIKGRREKTEKIGLKRMTKWLAEVWEGWIHWVLHLQNGFLMPRYRTQTLANRATFSWREKKPTRHP